MIAVIKMRLYSVGRFNRRLEWQFHLLKLDEITLESSSIIDLYLHAMNNVMSKSGELPAVHLSIDNLKTIEELLRENTTNYETEIVLSLPGGVEQKFYSVEQIDGKILADIDGLDSYYLSVTGNEGRCTIAGESTETESHMLYCQGDPDWSNEIHDGIKEYLKSVQTTKSRLRGELTGLKATGVTVLAALFVGWAVTAVSPQSVIHYFPHLSDAFVFFVGVFGLMIVRFRNWIHPYIRISENRSFQTTQRLERLAGAAFLLTLVILTIRWLIEPGPFIEFA